MSTLLFKHPMVCDAWEEFTDQDHHTWHTLFVRQTALLKERACTEMIQGMEKLEICSHKIPKLSSLNKILAQETGFTIVPVKGFIPEDLFFKMLSNRIFPSTCFIRKPEQLDYLQEPDIFHDIFGHVPLLVNPLFADFMVAFGKKGIEAIDQGMLNFAATLYWFTIEFGLVNTAEGIKIYGAGIASSKGETVYALDSKTPNRLKLNVERVMKTQYSIDSFQKTYFVIESFEKLFEIVEALDWCKLDHAFRDQQEIAEGVLLHSDDKL